MTLVDHLIPYYAWFRYGYADLSLPLAIISVSSVLVTLITVKGIYVPAYAIPIAVVAVSVACVGYGYVSVKYDIQNRVTQYLNQNTNPQIAMIPKMADDIERIKKAVGVE